MSGPWAKKEGVAVGEEMSRSGDAAAVKENGNPSDGFLLAEQGSRVRLQGGNVGEVALRFLLIDGAAGGFSRQMGDPLPAKVEGIIDAALRVCALHGEQVDPIAVGPEDPAAHGDPAVNLLIPLGESEDIRKRIGLCPAGTHIQQNAVVPMEEAVDPSGGWGLVEAVDGGDVVGGGIFVVLIMHFGAVSGGAHIVGDGFSVGEKGDAQAVEVIVLPAVGAVPYQQIPLIAPPQDGDARTVFVVIVFFGNQGDLRGGIVRQGGHAIEKRVMAVSGMIFVEQQQCFEQQRVTVMGIGKLGYLIVFQQRLDGEHIV